MSVGSLVISGSNIKTGAGATAVAQTITGVQGLVFDFGRSILTVALGGSGVFAGVPAASGAGDATREFDISALTTLTDVVASGNHTVTIS